MAAIKDEMRKDRVQPIINSEQTEWCCDIIDIHRERDINSFDVALPSQLTPQLQLFQQHDISSILQPILSPTTSTGATSSIPLTIEDEELQQAMNNLGLFF